MKLPFFLPCLFCFFFFVFACSVFGNRLRLQFSKVCELNFIAVHNGHVTSLDKALSSEKILSSSQLWICLTVTDKALLFTNFMEKNLWDVHFCCCYCLHAVDYVIAVTYLVMIWPTPFQLLSEIFSKLFPLLVSCWINYLRIYLQTLKAVSCSANHVLSNLSQNRGHICCLPSASSREMGTAS